MTRYRVHLVVDRGFGARMAALPDNEPVWIVDSVGNHGELGQIRQARSGQDQFTGITAFRDDPGCTPEELAIGILDEIELHHGELSHQPPYDALRVVGARPTVSLLEAARQMGLVTLRGKDFDFEVSRACQRDEADDG